MAIRKFTKEQLVDELGLPYEKAKGVEIIKDEISDTSRWSEHHDLIFKYEGKFYSTSYSNGLTEYQEEQPWEYDETIDCVEVEPYEKVIVDYRPVGKD